MKIKNIEIKLSENRIRFKIFRKNIEILNCEVEISIYKYHNTKPIFNFQRVNFEKFLNFDIPSDLLSKINKNNSLKNSNLFFIIFYFKKR
jgi:hypothetical protein